ncbi:unnamed protein product [Closterium sp. NIES-53]
MTAEPITVDVFPAVFLERDYEFMGEIGSGQYGKVWKCRSRLTGRQFACKQVKKRPARPARSGRGQQGRKNSAQRKTREGNGGISGADGGPGSGDDVDPIEREIAALTHLEGCEGVTSLHGVFEDATSVFLVMDLCDSGDLFSLIADTDGVPEDESRQLFADVARAVKACHDRGVLHRDIKPDNVLLSLRGTTATTNMGSSPMILTGGGRVRGYAGSFPYEAPEVVGLREYNFAADIWSMGVLLYALLSANWPEFKNRQALNEETDWTGASWDQVSEDAKDLIRRLLTVDQDRRPTIDEVLRHPWLAPATRVDRAESVDSVDCVDREKGTKSKQNPSLLPPLLIPSQSLDSRESTSLESASSIPSEASFLSALAATPASLPTPTATFTASSATYHAASERSNAIGAVSGGIRKQRRHANAAKAQAAEAQTAEAQTAKAQVNHGARTTT